MEEILKTLRDMIAEQFAIDPASVTMDTSYEDDLSADSVDLVELMMALEEAFEVEEIPEEELAGMKTVGDTVRYINSKMK
ncbi:MAG: acyl carrier protein [Oscillospiraceae bacterium]|nr:acyl carrier protein [Oscillospiraceae bacterium]